MVTGDVGDVEDESEKMLHATLNGTSATTNDALTARGNRDIAS